MPYYSIKGYKVFLSHSRWLEINRFAMAHKDPQFRVSAAIAGRPEAREAEELRVQYLNKLCQEDPTTFFQEWVEFDLRGREAQENAWDLLHDYCSFSRVGCLVDIRSEVCGIFSDYVGDSYAYPMGRVFALRVQASHSVTSMLRFNPRPSVTLEIDTSQIVSASGMLEEFRLEFRHCYFQCGPRLAVVFTDTEHETTE